MSYLLRLRELINKPSLVDFSGEYMALDQSDLPPLLIYDATLALELFKSKFLTPLNFIGYFKKLLRLSEGDLPTIDAIFEHAPIMLHGERHLIARKDFILQFKIIERDLMLFLPQYTQSFFREWASKKQLSPIEFTQNYIDGAFRGIFEKYLNIPYGGLPALPPKIFFLAHTLPNAGEAEDCLNDLKVFIDQRLEAQNRNASEAWALLAMLVLGFEPLEGALMFGLMRGEEVDIYNVENFLRESAPVNFLGRVATEDFTIGNFSVKTGQEIYISPVLIHQKSDLSSNGRKENFSFGKGLHTCVGQAISAKMAEHFFGELQKYSHLDFDINHVRSIRDFNLTFFKK